MLTHIAGRFSRRHIHHPAERPLRVRKGTCASHRPLPYVHSHQLSTSSNLQITLAGSALQAVCFLIQAFPSSFPIFAGSFFIGGVGISIEVGFKVIISCMRIYTDKYDVERTSKRVRRDPPARWGAQDGSPAVCVRCVFQCQSPFPPITSYTPRSTHCINAPNTLQASARCSLRSARRILPKFPRLPRFNPLI